MESYNIYLLNKMGIFNEQSDNQNPFARGIQGAQGVGLNLTADGNYDMVGKKKLTNLDDFDSIYNASQMLQINTGSIKLIAEGKRKTATSKFNSNKYSFKYFNSHDLDLVKHLKDRMRK